MGLIDINKFLWVGISFFAFLLICGALLENKFSRKGNIIALGGLAIGIIALQVVLLLSGQDLMLVLTMLPITAYLPAIIGIHILSKAGFYQTIAIWTLGLLIPYTLTFLQKILIQCLDLQGLTENIVLTVCLLFSTCLLLLIFFRYVRQPFFTYVLHNDTNWLPLCFSILMIFLLFSYLKNSTENLIVRILILLTAVSIFLVIAKALVSAATAQRIQEAEKEVSAQLNIQRQEYEDICKKMELGRNYRHDMRHHLAVLSSLAGENNNEEITKYISSLDVQIRETEQKIYCENATVNAVLSTYIGQAKEVDCTVTANVQIPSLLPFDALDICAILANALENAINACKNNDYAENRWIKLTAIFDEDRRFVISSENHCEKKLLFDNDGLPIVTNHEGHGIGLKSVKAVAQKYNGLFQCECSQNTFLLRAILFDSQEMPPQPKKRSRSKKVVTATLMSLLIFCISVNCIPAVQALEELPIIGSLIRVVDFRFYNFRWGDTKLYLELPKVEQVEIPTGNAQTHPSISNHTDGTSLPKSAPHTTAVPDSITEKTQILSPPSGTISLENDGDTNVDLSVSKPPIISYEPIHESPTSQPPPDLSEGVEEINWKMEEYIKLMREKFLWYVSRKYNGYVAINTTYTTLRNDDKLLLIRFDTTLNAGGSGTYSRCFVLDKQSGNVVELWDLFKENSNYVDIISNDIMRQMTEQVSAGLADYFIPGGIFPDSECFSKIAADQNFYINDKNQLVIVFDEYEVAPGKDGIPEFVISTEILNEILCHPSLLN